MNKLNDSERAHYEETITRLQSATTLQKMLLFFIAIVAFVGLIITVRAAQEDRREANLAIQRQSVLIQEIKRTSEEQNKLRSQQLDELNKHMDYIVLFFTHEERQNLTLEDIDNCVFSRSNGSTLRIESNSITNNIQQSQPEQPQVQQKPNEEKSQEQPKPEQPQNERRCTIDILGIKLICN